MTELATAPIPNNRHETLGPPIAELAPEAPPALTIPGVDVQTRNRFSLGRITALAGTLIATAGFSAATPANAEASTPVTDAATLPPTFTASFRTETSTARVRVADIARKKVTIVSNYSARPISRERLRRLRKNGDCEVFDGTKVKIRTAGLTPDGNGIYGPDYRTSEFCKINGRWIRVKCKNPATIDEEATPPPRNPDNRFIFVRSFSNLKVNIHAESRAEASCPDGSARGSGYASINQKVSLKTLVRTRGGSVVRFQNQLNDEARTEASAEVQCSSSSAEVTYTHPPGDHSNPSPVGYANPPRHRYINSGNGLACIDDIQDPDGGPVQASDFRFEDENGQAVGSWTNDVVRPDGTDKTQCVQFDPGNQPQDKVFMKANLNDGEGNIVGLKSDYSFPVLDRSAQ